MATNDGDSLARGVGALNLGDEAGGADNIESSDTEQTLGVVDVAGLVDLGNNGNGGVDLYNKHEFRPISISIFWCNSQGWQ